MNGKHNEFRVMGPPGTGKTTYLAKQIEHAAEKHGSENVVVASYTKAAATELNRRQLPIPRENIGTLHALCYRGLKQYEIAEVKAKEFNEAYPQDAISVTGSSQMDEMAADAVFATDGDKHLNNYNLWRAKCLDLSTLPPRTIAWLKKWESWKLNNHYIDFTDMISITLTMKEPMAGEPIVGIIDEVQDLNKLEMRLVRHWAKYQEYCIMAGDDDQCHPAGILISTSNRGQVPIECLDPNTDILWNFDKHGLQMYRAKSFRITNRFFDGMIVTINNNLQATYDHRIIARWNKRAIGAKAVYLMLKDHKWRIGITDLIRKKARGVFGVGQRARQEGADAAWVISIHDNPVHAMMMEERLSIKYGISQMVFHAPTKGALLRMTQEEIDNYHDEISASSRPLDLLSDCGFSIEHPMWIGDGKQRGKTAWQQVRIINVFADYMDIPTRHGKLYNKAMLVPELVHSVKKEFRACNVYSLDVLPHHTYVANGVIVHNCIYSFSGASPDAFLDREISADHKRVLNQSWRLPRAIHEFSQRWIKKIQNREPKEFNPKAEEGSVTYINATYKTPQAAIELAERYTRDGKTVMLLTTCGYLLNTIKTELRSAGLPFHNPFRSTRGDWNPMGSFNSQRSGRVSTRERILAFLDSSIGVSGNGYWNADKLSKWIELIRIKGILKKGAKERITTILEDRDGWIDDEATFYADIFEPYALEKAMQRDLAWFDQSLLAAKRSVAAYPLTVYKKQGIKALEEKPKLTIGTVHCSPPDEKVLTTSGYVPMDKLDANVHRVASYMFKCNKFTWNTSNNGKFNRGYEFKIAKNPYSGPLLTVITAESQTRITPDHRVRVKFADNFFNKWVVYLMRRGDWWRVGVCTSGKLPYQSGGILGRLATEKGDDGWVLSVCETRKEALIHEEIIRGKYGITGLTFQSAKNRSLDLEDLHRIHQSINGSTMARVMELFADFGLVMNAPLYRRNAGPQRVRNTYAFEIPACNLISGYMLFPVISENASSGTSPKWLPLTIEKKHYNGDVYSLEVMPHEHYVSGGAIVHNSVKGGEADVTILFPDMSAAAMEDYNHNPDATIRTFYVGMTRAKESLVICKPYSNMSVKLN